MRKSFYFACVCMLFPYMVYGSKYAQYTFLHAGEGIDTRSSVSLPIIHIDTKDNIISREERTPAVIHIEDIEGRLPQGLSTFTHQAGIKVRGKTAASFAKK